ncbi:MAG: hypothetical protein ABSG86_23035 [Thermoguttaceae bacterium]
MLRRSSEVQPGSDGCPAVCAKTRDGTTTVATVPEDTASRDFVLSVRELLDKGAVGGTQPFFAHRHVPPLECPAPFEQQQQVDPVPQQQQQQLP